MNPQQVAVALYKFWESQGVRASVRSIGRSMREQGLKFRESELRDWLCKFRDASRTQMDAPGRTGTQNSFGGDAPGRTGTQLDATGTRLRAQNNVSLLSNNTEIDDSLRSSSSRPAEQPNKNQVTPRQAKLPLDEAIQSRKREICDLIWTKLQPSVGRATTKTDWRKRNSRVAYTLAELGRTPQECLAAWESASRRLGSPVRMLSIVQDQLMREDSGEMDCGCGLGLSECDRLHSVKNSSDALPTIAELEAMWAQ